MLVELTPGEVETAYARANGINRSKRKLGIRHNVFHADVDEVMRHAMVAEAAFYKTFPAGIQSEVYDPRMGDGGVDFYFPRSKISVDIKSRTSDDRKLIIPERHFPPKADIYVLGVVRGGRVMFAGWVWGEYILENGRRAEGDEAGPYWCVSREELRPMSELFGELR